MKRVSERTWVGACAIAFALIAWILISSTRESNVALATEVRASTTTSQVATTTTTTPATSSSASYAFYLTPASTSPRLTRTGLVGLESTTNTSSSTSSTTTTPAAPAAVPVRIPRPSCATGLGAASARTAPFTGLSASIAANRPAVIVKVSNNSSKSRVALIGLDQADIIFEERIEASATRFAALFHSSLPPNVGPVRSGRTTDIQIMQNLNRPVLGYSGSNQGVAAQLKFAAENNLIVPVVNNDSAPFARDGRYKAPDNLFVDPASLGECGGGGNPTAIFTYGAATSTTSQPASSVSLQARSPYSFTWNGEGWARSQDGYAHTTRTGAALAPSNVVVLFVQYVPSAIDAASVDAQTIGSGAAWVLRDGTITTGSWSRERGLFPYTLTDGTGAATTLSPGQTWVVLAPAGSASWN